MKFYDYITEFIFAEDQPEKADIIFVPGGPYPDAARHAAMLYRAGFAPYIMPSGKYSILKGQLELPEELWQELAVRMQRFSKSTDSITAIIAEMKHRIRTESDYLCTVMKQEGVPESSLIGENQATYTYENAVYSRKKLEELNFSIKKAILCCQAFHARRSLLYYQEQFPEVEFLVCPVVTRGISRDSWYQTETGITTVLGEVERCGSQFHEIMRQYMRG